MDAPSLRGIPAGMDGARSGRSGRRGDARCAPRLHDALAYKRNLGGGMPRPAHASAEAQGREPLRRRASKSSTSTATGARTRLVDYPMSGFRERTDDDGWTGWKPFRFQPMLSVAVPMVRFIDLNGRRARGPDLGRRREPHVVPLARPRGLWPPHPDEPRTDEDRSPPRSFYTDTAQAILFADMTGDGLPDIVRVKNGSVCYWPNLGYGVFGAKVTLANAPQFDRPDRFDPKRIRLGDIDGSGTTDVLYLHPDGIRFYANQSGNALAPAVVLPRFPSADDATTISVVESAGLGHVVPGLVVAAPAERVLADALHGPAPGQQAAPAHVGHEQPRAHHDPDLHLVDRLLPRRSRGGPALDQQAPVPRAGGLERRDLRRREQGPARPHLCLPPRLLRRCGAGVPWVWHGRGARRRVVLALPRPGAAPAPDLPPAGAELLVPPVLTKTWFHTGYWPKGATLEAAFATEYFAGAPSPPATALPTGLGLNDAREAARALKGQILRQEVYAEDGSAVAAFPYAVSARSCDVTLLQASTERTHASFFTHARETVDYHFERKVDGGQADDARITHTLVVDVDPFGAVLRSAAVAYPRNPKYVDTDKTEQAALAITVSEADVYNSDPSALWYRLGVPLEERSFELLGLAAPAYPSVFAFNDVAGPARNAPDNRARRPANGDAAEAAPLAAPAPLPARRPLGPTRLRHGRLACPPLPELRKGVHIVRNHRGLRGPCHERDAHRGRVRADRRRPRLVDPVAPAALLRRRLLLPPHSFLDPFGNATVLVYDGYNLLVTTVTDAVTNVVASSNDYRILGPSLVTDPNGNRAAAQFDELGRMVASAVMGKVGSTDGDTLADPTVKVDYALDRWQTLGLPNRVHVSAREQHGPSNPGWQESYSYSDGSGQEVMKKVQTEPGPAPEVGPDGKVVKDASGNIVYVNAPSRWVGTGRTVVDNKGNPVKKYEPYFSANFEFEDDTDLVNWGVTPILRYDPLGRLVRTDLPNGTYTKSVFDAWHVEAWDPNDTVADSLWYAARSGLSQTTGEGRAAALALAHAGTPDVTYLDPQGRTFLAIQDNAGGNKYPTRTTLDVEGNALAVTDARGNAAQTTVFAMSKQPLTTTSCDAGQRWTLNDVRGQPFRGWDSRGNAVRTVFDVMRRPTQLFVQTGTQNETLAEVHVYGELVANADASNLRGKPYQVYDGAGAVTTSPYDFKGNLLATSRQVTLAYQAVPDWSALAVLTDPEAIAAAAQAALDATRAFPSSATYDALNRPTSMTTPDLSVIVPTYNEASLLQTVSVNLQGAATATPFVTNIDYNEKGQRVLLAYAQRRDDHVQLRPADIPHDRPQHDARRYRRPPGPELHVQPRRQHRRDRRRRPADRLLQ